MRTRTLILGALPQPFVGESCYIGDADEWQAVTVCNPNGVQIIGEIELTVTLHNGCEITVPMLPKGINISGMKVRASIVREIAGTRQVSVFVREVV